MRRDREKKRQEEEEISKPVENTPLLQQFQ